MNTHALTDAHTGVGAAQPLTIISPPGRGWLSLRLAEVWDYRELLYFLAWRDVKVHYKQAVLGVAWTVLQPILTMLIFTFLFGRVARLSPEGGVPYPLYVFAALLPWQLFSGALARSSASLVGNANLLTKVYFPRLIIPLSAVVSGLVDFLCSFGVLLLLVPWFVMRQDGWHFVPSWALLTLPLFVLYALLAALAVGLWLSALNVQFRDVQYVVPFLIQVWLFLSPVGYAPSAVMAGGIGRLLYGLNPMAGVIQGFRWALFGTTPPDVTMAISAGMTLALLIGGLLYFRRMEHSFADVV